LANGRIDEDLCVHVKLSGRQLGVQATLAEMDRKRKVTKKSSAAGPPRHVGSKKKSRTATYLREFYGWEIPKARRRAPYLGSTHFPTSAVP
jgi:hypothetical protein